MAYDPAGGDLQPFVDLIDTCGPDAVLAAVDELTDANHADITVSTAHMADREDFPPPKDTDQHDAEGRAAPEPVNNTDARLAYVAVTRARQKLDLEGLSWIDNHPPRARLHRAHALSASSEALADVRPQNSFFVEGFPTGIS